MRSLRKNTLVFLLGVFLMTSLGKAVPVYGQEMPVTFFACGVPIPDSAPGEETKDLVSGLIGLSALTAAVAGGLLVLQNRKSDKEK